MGVKYDLSTEAGMTSLREEVARLKLHGKRPVVTFDKDSKTDRQRAFQWGWLYKQIVLGLSEAGIEIPLEGGGGYPYDSEIIHEIFKKNIAKPLLIEIGRLSEAKAKGGKEIPQKISTEDLPMKDFSEYIKRCKEFTFNYWGFAVPAPEDAYYRAIEAEMRGEK